MDCMIGCCSLGFFSFGIVKLGWIGELLRCTSIVIIVSTNSFFCKI